MASVLFELDSSFRDTSKFPFAALKNVIAPPTANNLPPAPYKTSLLDIYADERRPQVFDDTHDYFQFVDIRRLMDSTQIRRLEWFLERSGDFDGIGMSIYGSDTSTNIVCVALAHGPKLFRIDIPDDFDFPMEREACGRVFKSIWQGKKVHVFGSHARCLRLAQYLPKSVWPKLYDCIDPRKPHNLVAELERKLNVRFDYNFKNNAEGQVLILEHFKGEWYRATRQEIIYLKNYVVLRAYFALIIARHDAKYNGSQATIKLSLLVSASVQEASVDPAEDEARQIAAGLAALTNSFEIEERSRNSKVEVDFESVTITRNTETGQRQLELHQSSYWTALPPTCKWLEVAFVPADVKEPFARSQMTKVPLAAEVKLDARQLAIPLPSDCSISGRITRVEADDSEPSMAFERWFRFLLKFMQGRKLPTGALQLIYATHFRMNSVTYTPLHPIISATEEDIVPYSAIREAKRSLHIAHLNNSQRIAAAQALEASAYFIYTAEGPPATGKTTTIAAVALLYSLITTDSTTVIVAQSNQSISHIAAELVARKVSKMLLVMADNWHSWYAEQYKDFETRITTTSALSTSGTTAADVRILLCTADTWMTAALDTFRNSTTRLHLLVDDVSQITVAKLLVILSYIPSGRESSCYCIGDRKQPGPANLARVRPSETSILAGPLDLVQIQRNAAFLDTQYRLPAQLCSILSHLIYEDRLKSGPGVSHEPYLQLVDCDKGCEDRRHMYSKQNEVEATEAARLLHQLYLQNRDNVKTRTFVCLTPYNGQRTLIISKCQIIDGGEWFAPEMVSSVASHVGRCADTVILSLVRTEDLGILADDCMANVALTRCNSQLIILAQRRFIESCCGILFSEFLKLSGQPWSEPGTVTP